MKISFVNPALRSVVIAFLTGSMEDWLSQARRI